MDNIFKINNTLNLDKADLTNPLFQDNTKYNSIYTEGICPISEDLQKKIMQFKTNYRSLKVARQKANILKELILRLECHTRKS